MHHQELRERLADLVEQGKALFPTIVPWATEVARTLLEAEDATRNVHQTEAFELLWDLIGAEALEYVLRDFRAIVGELKPQSVDDITAIAKSYGVTS